jgi:hypothetical protein
LTSSNSCCQGATTKTIPGIHSQEKRMLNRNPAYAETQLMRDPLMRDPDHEGSSSRGIHSCIPKFKIRSLGCTKMVRLLHPVLSSLQSCAPSVQSSVGYRPSSTDG